MNKFGMMLQTVALSLLLAGGAQATAHKPAPANKAAVVAAGSSSQHPHARHSRSSAKPMAKVNINSADAAAMNKVLLDIGPSKAAAIVSWRKQHGAFKSVDQLAEVKGIGLKTVEKNRDRIVVGAVAKR